MVVQFRPFDAVARADGMAVFPLGFRRVQQRGIIRQRHGQHAAIHQLDGQRVGRRLDAFYFKV